MWTSEKFSLNIQCVQKRKSDLQRVVRVGILSLPSVLTIVSWRVLRGLRTPFLLVRLFVTANVGEDAYTVRSSVPFVPFLITFTYHVHLCGSVVIQLRTGICTDSWLFLFQESLNCTLTYETYSARFYAERTREILDHETFRWSYFLTTHAFHVPEALNVHVKKKIIKVYFFLKNFFSKQWKINFWERKWDF